MPKNSNSRLLMDYPSVLKPSSGSRFQSQQEYRYFQTFCEKTVPTWAGLEEPDVWSRLVLQACERQESIRNAVIAIGALDQTLEAVQIGKRRPSFDLVGNMIVIT